MRKLLDETMGLTKEAAAPNALFLRCSVCEGPGVEDLGFLCTALPQSSPEGAGAASCY